MKCIIKHFEANGIFFAEKQTVLPNSQTMTTGKFDGKGKKYSFIISDKDKIITP